MVAPSSRSSRSAVRPCHRVEARPLAPGIGYFGLRSGAPIVPLVFGGTHELYRGRRIQMRVLPAVRAADLAAEASLSGAVTRRARRRACGRRRAPRHDRRGRRRRPSRDRAAPGTTQALALADARLPLTSCPAAERDLYSAAMHYAESILDLVGDTPLVRLTRVTRDLDVVGPPDRQPLILAKLEMLNPGGSVKDRIGLPMIEAAERAGLLQPGGTIIEPTSGNTGHGLAIAAALKGYRCIFVMADKQSPEKQALLRAYGAEVVLCPTNVAPESPESYYSVAARLARDIPGAFKPDQYWNIENTLAHERTTGPEIWRQTEGRLTHFVASVGTGGTISGAVHHLRAQNPAIRVIGADPEGSVLSGDTARPYLTEGVGEDFFPGTFDPATVDRWVRVSDRDAFAMARRITREEGILAGESCGTAVVAVLDEARRLMREAPDEAGRRDHGRAPARRRPVVHLEALQRRMDAGQRPAGDDRRGRPRGRPAGRASPARRADARPRAGAHDAAGRRGHRPAPGVRHQPDAGLRGARGRRPGLGRRLDQRAGAARPGLPRPVRRRAHRGRGHGSGAADARRRGQPR